MVKNPKYKDVVVQLILRPAPDAKAQETLKIDNLLRKFIDSINFTETFYYDFGIETGESYWQKKLFPELGLRLSLPNFQNFISEYDQNSGLLKLKGFKENKELKYYEICEKLKNILPKEEHQIVCSDEIIATYTPEYEIILKTLTKLSPEASLEENIDINNLYKIDQISGKIHSRNYVYLSTNLITSVGNTRFIYLELGDKIIKIDWICNQNINPSCVGLLMPFLWSIETIN
jgi:hypothetical protein